MENLDTGYSINAVESVIWHHVHRRLAECLLAREILASFSKFADVGQPARCYTLRRFVISFTCRLRVSPIVALLHASLPTFVPFSVHYSD